MGSTRITAVPMWYRGTLFRSTLEADWAATFDAWNWYWQYEPVAISIGDQAYRPDFYLPNFDVWCEVKGPHNQRMDKPVTLARDLEVDDPMVIRKPLVVILRPPGPAGGATWEAPLPGMDIVLARCPRCDWLTFVDTDGVWVCRQCWYGQGDQDKGSHLLHNCDPSGVVEFRRAPRITRRGA